MATIKSKMVGDVLVITFLEAEMTEESVIRRVEREFLLALKTFKASKILMNFRHVEAVSSAALGMLIRADKKLKDAQAMLKFCELSEDVCEFLRGAGPGQAGVFAKLKPRPSGDAAEAKPEDDEL